jgi:hypothetical protein
LRESQQGTQVYSSLSPRIFFLPQSLSALTSPDQTHRPSIRKANTPSTYAAETKRPTCVYNPFSTVAPTKLSHEQPKTKRKKIGKGWLSTRGMERAR